MARKLHSVSALVDKEFIAQVDSFLVQTIATHDMVIDRADLLRKWILEGMGKKASDYPNLPGNTKFYAN